MNRRDFLKTLSYNLGGLLLPGWFYSTESAGSQAGAGELLRVCTSQANIYRRPDRTSEVAGRRLRDDLLHGYYAVQADSGINRLWYRVWGGYVHSAGLQVVRHNLCQALPSLPQDGALVEVSVPYTQSMRHMGKAGWELNYRLYYGSTHWVEAVEEGPDGEAWYRIRDSYDRTYHACAAHLRPVTAEELAPISPQVPSDKKWIKVSIAGQTLTAYENDEVVMHTTISSGVPQLTPLEPDEISSETPLGNYHITVKTPSRHMGDKVLTGKVDTLALPGVPWVSFFHELGVSLHGAYWHTNFGLQMSHGCINMRCEEAKWIYRWAQPVIQPDQRQTSAWGTRVYVVDTDAA